jgi:RNA polymerase sigma factor (TIGR02999 family)
VARSGTWINGLLRIKLLHMADVTRLLNSIEKGHAHAADDLLPLVYAELRKLARSKLKQERPGQTLQPTALVHEAFVRLVNDDCRDNWQSRGHFFAAAAEAMRRILVENARRKTRLKHGGGREREELADIAVSEDKTDQRLLALDGVLDQLAAEDPAKAQLVKLRYFAGMNEEEAAAALGISRATAARHWSYARAWIFDALKSSET